MKVFVVVACFLAGCLAGKPHPCRSPPLLAGSLTVSTQNEKLWVFSKYLYDALGQRVRLWELGTYKNQSFTYDILLLFNESTVFQIDDKARTCKKAALKATFHPMEIPKDASLLGQAVLGSSSGPGQGLLVNTWTGEIPENGVQYLTTFTEFGCIPISTSYKTNDYGWMLTSFFNNIIGIPDPSLLNPPNFCQTAEAMDSQETEDFLSLFANMK